MPLETAVTISGLEALWPLSSDPVNEGEDHLQLIKSVLQLQFPGAGGNGFNTPITATEDDLNNTSGSTSNFQQQIDDILTGVSGALDAPAGTILLFANTTMPPGWTKMTTVNDAMVRMVSGTAGSAGGNESPIAMNIQHSHTTAAHELSIAELPNHSHKMFFDGDTDQDITASYPLASANYDNGTTGANSYRMKGFSSGTPTLGKSSYEGGDAGHNHGPTGTYIRTLTPKYINVNAGIRDGS